MALPEVCLTMGEKDGQHFRMPQEWNAFEPPLHCWVLTAEADAAINRAKYSHQPLPVFEATCAYKYCDKGLTTSGIIAELIYERDYSADLPAGAYVEPHLRHQTPC